MVRMPCGLPELLAWCPTRTLKAMLFQLTVVLDGIDEAKDTLFGSSASVGNGRMQFPPNNPHYNSVGVFAARDLQECVVLYEMHRDRVGSADKGRRIRITLINGENALWPARTLSMVPNTDSESHALQNIHIKMSLADMGQARDRIQSIYSKYPWEIFSVHFFVRNDHLAADVSSSLSVLECLGTPPFFYFTVLYLCTNHFDSLPDSEL